MFDYEIADEFKNCKHFSGVFPRDRLPKNSKIKRPCGFILNFDKKGDPGTHWVAITLLKDNKGEYFDSFGLPPLHQDIRNYLNTHCSNGWIYNPISLQHPFSNSCGQYAIAFLKDRFNNNPFISFLNSFSSSQIKNEKIIQDGFQTKKWKHS